MDEKELMKIIEAICESENIYTMSGMYFIDMSRVVKNSDKTKQVRVFFNTGKRLSFVTFSYEPSICIGKFIVNFREFIERNIETITGGKKDVSCVL